MTSSPYSDEYKTRAVNLVDEHGLADAYNQLKTEATPTQRAPDRSTIQRWAKTAGIPTCSATLRDQTTNAVTERNHRHAEGMAALRDRVLGLANHAIDLAEQAARTSDLKNATTSAAICIDKLAVMSGTVAPADGRDGDGELAEAGEARLQEILDTVVEDELAKRRKAG